MGGAFGVRVEQILQYGGVHFIHVFVGFADIAIAVFHKPHRGFGFPAEELHFIPLGIRIEEVPPHRVVAVGDSGEGRQRGEDVRLAARAAVDAGLQFARSDEAGRVDEHGRMVALEAAGQIAGGHVQGRVVQAVIAENGEHGVVEPGLLPGDFEELAERVVGEAERVVFVRAGETVVFEDGFGRLFDLESRVVFGGTPPSG